MRVHANQLNPYAQLDALHATQKAAAKREAAKTRKKLLESASALADESDSEDAAVAPLQATQETQEHSRRQNPQKQGSENKPNGASKSKDGDDEHDNDNAMSEWA